MLIDQPIGVFDSGFGGASVLREAIKLLPNENYIYYGDNKNAPYGDRTETEISTLTLRCADELLSHNVKTLLIACNTATATCVELVRAKLNVPVISMEPAIKPACEHEGNGKILMLATLATTRFERYLALQERMPDPKRVINVPCPGIVEIVEQGKLDFADYEAILTKLLWPYEKMKIDGIVLGCTHYVFIKDVISRYANAHFCGEHILYDGNHATIMQLTKVLCDNNMLQDKNKKGGITFCTSGNVTELKSTFGMLLNRNDVKLL